jgi:hypothetical protein
MARKVAWGTPGHSAHYLKPRAPFKLLVVALGLGVSLAVLFLLMQVSGLRGPLAPGELVSAHAPVEARCQECHAAASIGASNLRCQRCHDPGGAGRLTQGAHVLFGSRDAKQAAAAEGRRCAQCHVEHRGRLVRLAAVDEGYCLACHFPSFQVHPEFLALRAPTREAPGLKFSHERHVKEVAKTAGTPAQTCVKCHEPEGRDMAKISFDRHCATCHLATGSIGVVDPVPEQDVAPAGAAGLDVSRGRVSKAVVSHRDPWVMASLRKLRQELDPEGYAAERGALLARLSQLRRRLALAPPLAGLDGAALKGRQDTLQLEIKGVEARIAAQAAAEGPGAGILRMEDVASVAGRTQDAAASAEAGQLETLAKAIGEAPPAALPPADHEARRRELLAALDAIESADPSLRPRAEDLRRRVAALAPGETGLEILARVRDQRAAELLRVRDETEMRRLGAAPPRSAVAAGQARVIQTAIGEIEARLKELPEVAPRALLPEERARKLETAEIVAVACAKCHLVATGGFARVRAAQPVLVRSSFAHRPHILQAECARCHAGIESSKLSQDLSFKGIKSCRECHRPSAAMADCQSCHTYHPPAGP